MSSAAVRTCSRRLVHAGAHGSLLVLALWAACLFHAPHRARAQATAFSVEGWGQTYRPAGLASFEAQATSYPWIRAETQVWAGQAPLPDGTPGDVVVLAAHLREPTGHLEARAGRFVLTTGAVRPVHLDGGYVRGQTDWGTALEGFSGVPVVPRFGTREYDWLAGGRLSQRVSDVATVGVSYVERRDRGIETDEEIGADAVVYPMRHVDLSGRFSWDLVSAGMSELNVTGAVGTLDRRVEAFTIVRNASLILPATSLFSVLSNAPSLQTGMSGRVRLAPRLRVDALGAFRSYDDLIGLRARLGATLWLDDEGDGAIEGAITRDGVEGQRWSGVRALVYRDIVRDLRMMAEVELVLPDDDEGKGTVWPWGRLSGRYTWREHWQLSAGVEGSSSPQFVRIFQGLFRVAYSFEGGAT